MSKLEEIVRRLASRPTEEEWYEFKENWFEPHAIGEYISALSNAAALKGEPFGYFIWGINDNTHDFTGTSINYQKDIKNEPFQHYLARQISPDLAFTFHELEISRCRIVALVIPAASKAPTSFDGVRYVRIGSSKENVAKYPDREAQLFKVLLKGQPTVANTEASVQELYFTKLFTYYAGRGITLKTQNFKKNLGLLTDEGRYNVLAQLLSDDCRMPIRVSIFTGKTKASSLYSIKEFGNTSILLALDKILEYGDVINLVQVDERNRIMERKDIALFDFDAFREAMINAFVHNKWIDGNAPMITVFSDRIEILSRGSLAPSQTIEGFYLGESVPVNQKLSDIFLQLHISERSGRGVPTIVEKYGRNVFEFRENSIVVSIPFNYINTTKTGGVVDKPVDKPVDKIKTEYRVLEEIRNNPNITQPQLVTKIGVGKTRIQSCISLLKKQGLIRRIGSNKDGYWEIIEQK
ncbi:MAG: putative DNA binding domain-containing protein [Erysipelotrichaceae bacterium]|nr:putative DNA binding domain-containing protein [Erysipelotrichaceae bacterium]